MHKPFVAYQNNNAPAMKAVPKRAGAIFETRRSFQPSDPAAFKSARKCIQSSSVTSCVEKGCGRMIDGGRVAGKPFERYWWPSEGMVIISNSGNCWSDGGAREKHPGGGLSSFWSDFPPANLWTWLGCLLELGMCVGAYPL